MKNLEYPYTTRAEYNQSNENTENKNAIEYLKQIGLLIPMSKLTLYHGRCNRDNTEWQVRSDVDNSGKGTLNVHKIPALSTTEDLSIAQDFANTRTEGHGGTAECHQILADNPNALIFDTNAQISQTPEERKQLIKSIKLLSPTALEGAPLNFENRKILEGFSYKNFQTDNSLAITFDEEKTASDFMTPLSDMQMIANKTQLDLKTVTQIAGAINAKTLLQLFPKYLVHDFVFTSHDTFEVPLSEKTTQTVPINREYIAAWLKHNNIIGAKGTVRSVTINKVIESITLFDLNNINTKKVIEGKHEKRAELLGKLAAELHKALSQSPEKTSPIVELLLKNFYIKPQNIIDEAKKVQGYENLFNEDAGNWEKYTIGQHIETVLRAFDYNYADKIPAELLPFMRLTLLTHDLGKPNAVKNNEKHKQMEYNIKQAKDF